MPVAVKVTVVPAHTLLADALRETVGARLLFTVNVIPVEVAAVPLKQPGNVPPAVWIALMTSPFAGL